VTLLVKCVYYPLPYIYVAVCMYVCSVQYFVSLLFASLCSFLITRLMIFSILFYDCFPVSAYLFLILCILCFCFLCIFFLLYIAVSFLILYKCTEYCHQVETQLH